VNQYRHLRVNGRCIEYRRLGNSERLTIVMLHEGLGCVALWRDFPEKLAAATGCDVFLYSRFGYGGSDSAPLPWPLDYMQREGLYGLPAVLDAAQIGPCLLLGHSDGASIALVNAGAVKDPRVRGVIVMAPHVFVESNGLASIAAAREAFVTGDLRKKLAKYHGDNVDHAFYGWSDSWLDPEFRTWNIESYLENIAVPVLQLQGADDQYGTVRQLRAITRQVRSEVKTYVLGDCQHAPQFAQPEYTLHLIKRFITRHR
jgi:pimeloyl-ACP methyl ester carboxylesterase